MTFSPCSYISNRK